MSLNNWVQAEVSRDEAKCLATECGISLFLAEILSSRGFKTKEETLSFLHPSGEFHDPFLMKDMDKAVNRILMAIDHGECITVYGDYDCDGVTSTALLVSYLESMGAQVSYYIPDRFLEGYGLHRQAIEQIAKNGTTLIITVDNGISALDEISYAKDLGVDVVVTDHHQPREILPDAVAIVDPHRKDCPYPFKHLAGVGVAFKLICALENAPDEDMMEYYGDILAIGTIGDIVSLHGENRLMVQKGLEKLKETFHVGLLALSEQCGIHIDKGESIPVSFGIVPRINAAGRMGDPKLAVRLLLTDDEEEASLLSQALDQKNRERQEIEKKIIQDIAKRLSKDRLPLMERVVVLEAENWHHGVIGIVASRMVNHYGKPCILISIDGEEARGSCRGVEGFSMIDAVAACKEVLSHYGGHTLAAGFSLKTEDIGRFKELLAAFTKEHYENMPYHAIHLDKELYPDELKIENVRELRCLEPFGQGNEKPVFCIRNAKLTGITELSGGKHLKLRLQKDKAEFYILCFGRTKKDFPYQIRDLLDLAVECDINCYGGSESVSVKAKDIRLSGFRQGEYFRGKNVYDRFLRQEQLDKQTLETIVPTREEIAVVYRYLRSCKVFPYDPEILFARIMDPTIGYCKMMMILEILEELHLIRSSDQEIRVVVNPKKTNIEQSAFLQKIRQL